MSRIALLNKIADKMSDVELEKLASDKLSVDDIISLSKQADALDSTPGVAAAKEMWNQGALGFRHAFDPKSLYVDPAATVGSFPKGVKMHKFLENMKGTDWMTANKDKVLKTLMAEGAAGESTLGRVGSAFKGLGASAAGNPGPVVLGAIAAKLLYDKMTAQDHPKVVLASDKEAELVLEKLADDPAIALATLILGSNGLLD